MVEPERGLAVLGAERRGAEHLPPRAHQRVAADELVAEPRHVPAPLDAVQPERDLGQLACDGIEVDPVDVAVGDVELHLLQLVGVLRVRDPLAALALLALQVLLRELVHRLVQECGRAHGGLADREVEDAVGRHVVRNQLAQGVLDHATGERFRCVVARRLLPVAAREAVDEAAPRMDAELPAALLVAVVDALLLLVVVEVARRHEPGALEHVAVLAGLLHLVQVLLGEEAAVRQQRFVDRAELVDAELSVGDAPAPAAPALGGPGERHQADHLLQHAVAQLHPVEQRRRAGAEQGAVEGADAEAVVQVRRRSRRQQIDGAALPGAVEAVPDQAEQGLDGVVQVVAVERFLAGQAHQLEVAQVLQAVALAVGLRLHRRVAEIGARLDVEEEQQPVHVAQAFQAELPGERGVGTVVELVLEHLAQVTNRLVADQLDRFAQRVLQVLGDGEGVLVAVLVQAVEQAPAVRRQQAVAVQQGGGGLQGGVLAAAEDLVEVEAQQPVVRPLPALDQQDTAEGEHQHPARRVVLAEDAPRHDVVPGFAQERLRRRRLAVELQAVRPERERVFPFRLRVVRAEGQQRGRAGLAARGAEHRHLVAVVEQVIGRTPLVAERGEKVPEPLALQGQPLSAAAFAIEVAAEPHILAGQRTQRRVRRSSSLGLRFFTPAIHGCPNVAAEDLRQIVVAVELVLVVDPGEGGGGRGGHESMRSSRCRRKGPVRAGTRRGCA